MGFVLYLPLYTQATLILTSSASLEHRSYINAAIHRYKYTEEKSVQIRAGGKNIQTRFRSRAENIVHQTTTYVES